MIFQHAVRRLVKSQRVPSVRCCAVTLFRFLHQRFTAKVAHRFVEIEFTGAIKRRCFPRNRQRVRRFKPAALDFPEQQTRPHDLHAVERKRHRRQKQYPSVLQKPDLSFQRPDLIRKRVKRGNPVAFSDRKHGRTAFAFPHQHRRELPLARACVRIKPLHVHKRKIPVPFKEIPHRFLVLLRRKRAGSVNKPSAGLYRLGGVV